MILIFGVLPALAIYLVADHLIGFSEKNTLVSAQKELRGKLIRIAERASPEGFYFHIFDRLYGLLRRAHTADRLSVAQALLTDCAARYKVAFTPYLFNDRGEMTQITAVVSPNRFIISKIWDILAETPRYQPGDDEKKNLKKIQLLLGAEANAGQLKNLEGHLITLKKKKMTGFFYWQKFSPDSKAGVIFLVMDNVNTQTLLQKHLGQNPGADFELSYWSQGSSLPLFTNSDQSVAMLMRNALEKSDQSSVVAGHRLWGLLNTGYGVFVGSSPSPHLKLHNVRGLLNLCFFMTLLILLLLLANSRLNLHDSYIRIGNKLSAIFLVVIAVPVAALVITGIFSISAHEKFLLSRIEKEQKQRLSAIEDDFINEEFAFKSMCNNLRLQAVEFSLPEFQKHSQELLQRRQAVRIELRKLDGDLISMSNAGGFFEGLEKCNDAFSRYLIRCNLEDRLNDELTVIKHPPDQVFTDLFASSDFGFAQVGEAPDRVHFFRFGQNEMFWYWTYFSQPGHPTAILSVFQAVAIARENFLNKVLDESSPDAQNLAVFNCSRRNWLKRDFSQTNAVADTVRTAQISKQPESSIVDHPEGKFMVMAMPGTLLAPYSLVSLTSTAEVKNRINQLYIALVMGIILIFFVAMATASLLARTFLEPINELARGTLQLQGHGHDTRVMIDSGDEFGELATAFNQMVDDLKEMQLAKVVQESLFPQEKPQIDGFDTAIFNLTATDLGGDYCDVFQVSKEQWLLLIGDVSGHGTPAALCMAMVKAAIFKACRDGLQFESLAGYVSAMMLKTLERKKMMTMLFVLLDTEKNTVQMINAGHNWPVILRKDGLVEEIEILGLPLGVREPKQGRIQVTRTLNPGDTLFCYTDALIECRSPENEVFGHEQLYQELAHLSEKSSQELIDHLKAGWLQFIAGGIREDDLTMLVLKNCQQDNSPK